MFLTGASSRRGPVWAPRLWRVAGSDHTGDRRGDHSQNSPRCAHATWGWARLFAAVREPSGAVECGGLPAWCALVVRRSAFDRAGIEAGIAHQLHAIGRDVDNKPRDAVESRTGDHLLHASGGVDVPVGNLLTYLALSVFTLGTPIPSNLIDSVVKGDWFGRCFGRTSVTNPPEVPCTDRCFQ